MARTNLFEDIFSVSGEVRRDVELGMEDAVNGSLPVLSTEWRLEGGERREGRGGRGGKENKPFDQTAVGWTD